MSNFPRNPNIGSGAGKEVSSIRIKKRRKNQRSWFYINIGIIGLVAVLVGFGKPFILPVSQGTFQAPISIYVHGAFALGWVLLYLVQGLLIRNRNYKLHLYLGFLGIFIALGAAITIIPAALFQMERELKQGLGDTAISSLLGAVTSGLMYLSLFFAGFFYRKNIQAHKRLMLLATLVILWPAWFRFRHYFPAVPRPEIWFAIILADSFIIISMIWDKLINKKIHPVLLYLGPLIILEHIFEAFSFDSHYWRIISKELYKLIS